MSNVYPAKILLLGKTGVGKSSFINYFLGKNAAKTGVGKPVTQGYLIEYKSDVNGFPVYVYDNKGLEAKTSREQMDKIIHVLKERNNGQDVTNWFHTIFYCISMASARFEPAELEFLKEIKKSISQHVHIILTQCDQCRPQAVADMKKLIHSKLPNENYEIFEVVSVERKMRDGTCSQPRGREQIIGSIFDILWGDISYRIAADYAHELRDGWLEYIDAICSAHETLFKKYFGLGGLVTLGRATLRGTEDELDAEVESLLTSFSEQLEDKRSNVDAKFKSILRPAADLYSGYYSAFSGDFTEFAGLSFGGATAKWFDFDFDDDEFLPSVFPHYEELDDCDLDSKSVTEKLAIVRDCLGDIIFLKRNGLNYAKDLRQKMLRSLPSEEQIREKVEKRLLDCIKQS